LVKHKVLKRDTVLELHSCRDGGSTCMIKLFIVVALNQF
jgi:hypothetical protein